MEEKIESFGNTNILLHKKEKQAIFLNEETGNIGIEIDGFIIFKSIEEWHKIGKGKEDDKNI